MKEAYFRNTGKIRIYVENIISFYITLVVLCRCVRLHWGFTFLGIALLMLYIMYGFKNRESYVITKIDVVFLLLVPLYFYNNRLDSLISVAVSVVSWICFLVFRKNKEFFKGTMAALVFFATIDLFINIINLISPNTYFGFVNHFLTPFEAGSAINYFKKFGYLCGISGHYSRNAYFLVAGFSVAFSYILSGKKKKKIFWFLFAGIMVLMLMRIGKRGHFLFMISAALLVYLLTSASVSQKIQRLLFFIVVSIAFLGVVIEFVPSIGYVFQRFLLLGNGQDITSGRTKLYIQAWELFCRNPILGIGYGNFTLNTLSYFNYQYAGVHNDYLQWLCETGSVGFIINILFAAGVYILSLREMKLLVSTKKKEGTFEQIMIIWSVFFQTFILLYSFTGIPHYDREVFPIYYISCAVPFALLKLPECSVIKLKKWKLK